MTIPSSVHSMWIPPATRLPLRDGDVGRFLGHEYDGQRSDPVLEETKLVPKHAQFRNATIGVTFRWNSNDHWVPNDRVNDPNGCRHCDMSRRDHCQGWVPVVGIHGFVEPTDEQRLERMRWRYLLRATGIRRKLP